MKQLLFFFFLFLASQGFAQRYVFYLHGRIVEVQGPNAMETINGYGAYKYQDILDSLKRPGITVLSEVRPADTQVKAYAQKLAGKLDSLIKKGVPAANITVIGASKGSHIAMEVSSLMKNREMNFVLMAACSDGQSEPLLYGNILSIYEKSDLYGSCESLRKNSKGINHYKEVQINTGLKHGFLYKPLPQWLKPALTWAQGIYN